MKKHYLFILLGLLAMQVNALTYTVTVPAGTLDCYIAGEFNGWSFLKMNRVDETNFTIDIPDATATQGYKYCAGAGWAYVEKDASGNDVGNRTYSASDVVAEWNSVYSISYLGNSYVTVGGKESANVQWYNGSGTGQTDNFSGSLIGDYDTALVLGGEVEVYMSSDVDALMYYQIDGGTVLSIALPKVGSVGNNSKHYGEATVDVSGLSAGTHTVKVWFKARADMDLTDPNDGSGWQATFTKTSTDIADAKATIAPYQVEAGLLSVPFEGSKVIGLYTLTGRTIAYGVMQNGYDITLDRGIYLLRIDKKAFKIVVR